MDGLLSHSGTELITRDALALLPTPEGTETHRPVPHIDVVNGLMETLSFRHINVVRDEYAVSPDANRMFGLMELELSFSGCRLAIGLRNAHDKSMRLGLTVGYRVFVCDNFAFHGDFTPVLAKHTKHFNLENALAMGVDQMQRHFEPMKAQVQGWRAEQIDDQLARIIIYRAFIEEQLEAPKHLARKVHELYFNPLHADFEPRTIWSLSNSFTSAFKQLDPIPRFKATASLGAFLRN